MKDLIYELKKCKECSCSRCHFNGTSGCYIEMAIKELNRYEQAFDALEKHSFDDLIKNNNEE